MKGREKGKGLGCDEQIGGLTEGALGRDHKEQGMH